MKILHTGDIHLGDLPGPVRDEKNVRRQDTVACMREIVRVAGQVRPQVTVIAGDLFNRSRVWGDTALEDVRDAAELFLRPLCTCSEHVVLLFGTDNHDNPRAYRLLQETLARECGNLLIYDRPQLATLQTSDGPVQVAAVPGFDKGRMRLFCPTADKEEENRTATALVNDVVLGLTAQADPETPCILTAHYTVAGSEADNGSTFLAGQDVVLLPATLSMSGCALVCLGHIHRAQKINCAVPAFYCGSVNQLTFNDEGHQMGFWLHTMDPGTRDVTSAFMPTPARPHLTVNVGEADVSEVLQGNTLNLPPAVRDAVVRINYTCSLEQEKALNRADLQKQLLAAGALYVAQITPVDMEELDAGPELTEHDGPTEALARWLDLAGAPEQDVARLMELATPLIRRADDGRDDNRRTGAFTPERVLVTNYRSYATAEFSFEPVHMAMVNGHNGVGKSSLFMYAIADALYEESRDGAVGSWVRQGTKSGSITFEFLMGGERYRVVRTRTKSGRGTLALNRIEPESGEWLNESDTTMALTQQKIVRLIGMDYRTFSTIALIQQDAYGVFLEAGAGERMAILSTLLGLDVYARLEALAKECASGKRREIAILHDRLDVLDQQIGEREGLEYERAHLLDTRAGVETALATVDRGLAAAQADEAAREDIMRQVREKQEEADEAAQKIEGKQLILDRSRVQLEKLQELISKEPAAKSAAEKVSAARAELARYEPDEIKLRELQTRLSSLKGELDREQGLLARYESTRVTYQNVLGRREAVERAVSESEAVKAQREQLEQKRIERAAAAEEQRHIREALNASLSEARVNINDLRARVDEAKRKAALLDNSRCPIAEHATCSFLEDAVAAQKELPRLQEQLRCLKVSSRAEYERLGQIYDESCQKVASFGDPSEELAKLSQHERTLAPLLSMSGQVEMAASQIEKLEQQISESQQQILVLDDEIAKISDDMPRLENIVRRANGARASVREHEALAELLPSCVNAAATVQTMIPQQEDLQREIREYQKKRQSVLTAMDCLLKRLPQENGPETELLRDRRQKLMLYMQQIDVRTGAIDARLEQLHQSEEQAAGYRSNISQLAVDLKDYETLVAAFGLDGIQYMLIRSVVPEIMHRANEILGAMTGGEKAVDIRTEREQRTSQKIINTLEVWVASMEGGSRPYLSHSGGEKVKVALAVTLALADVKARRAGVQLGMLFIDEPPFLDAEGTESYADALAAMSARNPGMRILAISHDPTMKARFPQNITVSDGPDGSVVSFDS